MRSFSEFLNNEENQKVVLDKIIEALRYRNEWGRHGLFTAIGNEIGFSAAYVGQIFNRSKPLRENFVERIAKYLKVDKMWLFGNIDSTYEIAEIDYLLEEHSDEKSLNRDNEFSTNLEKYKYLIDVFNKVPVDEMGVVIDILKSYWKFRSDQLGNEDITKE